MDIAEKLFNGVKSVCKRLFCIYSSIETITFQLRKNKILHIYVVGSNFDVGAYDGIARAVNDEGSFTECRFPIYISCKCATSVYC